MPTLFTERRDRVSCACVSSVARTDNETLILTFSAPMSSVVSLPTPNRAGGLTASFLAYLCWGFMPIYWSFLSRADSWEVIAHRVLWSLVVLAVIFTATGRLRTARDTARLLWEQKRTLVLLFSAAAVAAVNWWINVLAAHVDRVIELGIGMFLTPLLSVAIGCLVFKERLSGLRRISLALAACGVAVLAFNYGRIPWIAVGVSATWACYGALKKKIRIDAWMSNAFECVVLLPAAAVYLWWLNAEGLSAFGPANPGVSTALAGLGVVTLIPMVAFAYAAQNLPLYLLGFCQFLNPVLTIFTGVVILGEPFNKAFAAPLLFIAAAVVLFISAELLDLRRMRRGG